MNQLNSQERERESRGLVRLSFAKQKLGGFTLLELLIVTPMRKSFQLFVRGKSPSYSRGFTLLELLIVIAILAVLAAVTVVVLNPAELLRQARDGQRVAQLSSLETAIGMFLVDGRGAPRGSPNVVHISLPDTSSTCVNLVLPPLNHPWTYRCVPAANLRRIDGTGWIPIDFTLIPGGSPLPVLPIDPTNNATHYFAYVTGGSYALTAMPESSRFLQRNANRDGGTDPARIEAGTSRALWARATGLVGYWPLDGNFQDHSGLANHGTQTGGVSFAEGRQNQAGRFDGVDDRISGSGLPLITGPWTLCAWVNPPTTRNQFIVNTHSACGGLSMDIRDGNSIAIHKSCAHCCASSIRTVVLNQWNHVCLTWDNVNTHLVAINESIEILTQAVQPIASNGGFTIGNRGETPTDLFHGLIDEVRIYNRALTADEIRAIFEATR